MAYKTILVHVDDSRNVDTRIAMAAELALRHEAHLVGAAATGISRFVYQSMTAGIDAGIIDGYMADLESRANRSLEHFEEIVRRLGVPSYEMRPAMDEPANGLSLQARYADLCVLSQFDRDAPMPASYANLPEYVAMTGGCPVLVVPNACTRPGIGEHVLVAWNGSLDARRAVQGAMPLLQQAASVEMVTFQGAGLSDLAGEQPALDAASWLARHNVKVNLHERRGNGEIGEALLSLAGDLGVDMLVMGCYGHSRFREILLGGATRTMLLSMTSPVLMAH